VTRRDGEPGAPECKPGPPQEREPASRAPGAPDYRAAPGGNVPAAMSLVRTDRLDVPRPGAPASARGRLRESYPAIPSSVPVARRAIADCAVEAGATGEQLEAIRLASSEALTNVVQYAYRSRTGHIYVTARAAGGEFWVLISDNGCGIRAGSDSAGLGLGLALISQVADGFSVVQRSTGGTELRLRFVLGRGESA
jgi:anti-sigma regulatory factor (Ser/Thr protein kinase)